MLEIVAPGFIRKACGAVSQTRLNSADSVLAPYLDHHQHLPREARRMTALLDAALRACLPHRRGTSQTFLIFAPFRNAPDARP